MWDEKNIPETVFGNGMSAITECNFMRPGSGWHGATISSSRQVQLMLQKMSRRKKLPFRLELFSKNGFFRQ